MKLEPWVNVIKPREDLREGRPLDASEFAVHLDHVREGRGPDVYRNPEEFFERTHLTNNLLEMAAEVLNRLSGKKVETSAVFNMMTPFGGGGEDPRFDPPLPLGFERPCSRWLEWGLLDSFQSGVGIST